MATATFAVQNLLYRRGTRHGRERPPESGVGPGAPHPRWGRSRPTLPCCPLPRAAHRAARCPRRLPGSGRRTCTPTTSSGARVRLTRASVTVAMAAERGRCPLTDARWRLVPSPVPLTAASGLASRERDDVLTWKDSLPIRRSSFWGRSASTAFYRATPPSARRSACSRLRSTEPGHQPSLDSRQARRV